MSRYNIILLTMTGCAFAALVLIYWRYTVTSVRQSNETFEGLNQWVSDLTTRPESPPQP